MSSIVAIGSMAFDSIETPFSKVDQVLGGSLNHFAISASYFTKIHCVGVIGEDFPKEHLEILKNRGIDTRGIVTEKGKTFHWSGRYSYDLHNAETLSTCLNVFERFDPELPDSYRKVPYVFLGNISPNIQSKVLAQTENPKFVALDTMNYWIEGQKTDLIKVLLRVNALLINEEEIRQLTQKYNIVQAYQIVRQWGPQIVVVKRGEYGAVLFDHGETFCVPGLPLSEVKDPTGAGDAFAGGLMGYLASQGPLPISRSLLRKATVYGSVLASFIVQDFGFREIVSLTREQIEERYQSFIDLTLFHGSR